MKMRRKKRRMFTARSLGKPLRFLGRVVIAVGALGLIGSSSDPYRRNLMFLIATWGLMIAFEGSILSELDLISQRYKLKIIRVIICAAPVLSTIGVLMWALYQQLTSSWGLTLSGALSIGFFYRLYQSQSNSRASKDKVLEGKRWPDLHERRE